MGINKSSTSVVMSLNDFKREIEKNDDGRCLVARPSKFGSQFAIVLNQTIKMLATPNRFGQYDVVKFI